MAYSPPLRADQYPLVDDPDDLTTTLLALVDGVGMAQVVPSDIAGAPGPEWSPASAAAVTAYTTSDYFVVDQGGVAKRVPASLASPYVDVRRFGAVGDGVTDDTSAIAAAWAASKYLFFPAGNWVYNGAGLDPGGVTFAIKGVGRNGTIITLGASSYLIDSSSVVPACTVEGLTIDNGLGACRWTSTTAATAQSGKVFRDIYFLDYTKAAVSHESTDCPNWRFEFCTFWAAQFDGSMGVALKGLSDNTVIDNCEFRRNEISVKLEKGGNNAHLTNSQFIRFSGSRTRPAIDVWVVPLASTSTNSGQGFTVRDCKFGNENIAAGDYRIVYADEGAGTYFADRLPALTTTSTGYISGHTITGCAYSGSGVILPPLVYSTTPRLGGIGITDLTIQGGTPAYVVQLYSAPVAGADYHVKGNTIGPVRSVFTNVSNAATTEACNYTGLFHVIDPHQFFESSPTEATPERAGDAAEYVSLLANDLSAYTNFATVGGSATTDALGGTSSGTMTLTTTGVNEIFTTTHTGVVPIWIEFDARQAAGTPLDYMTVQLRTSSTIVFQRTVRLATPWRHFRFSTTLLGGETNMSLQFRTISGTGTVEVGRARVYHARGPMQRIPGVAVTAAGIHAALVQLGLITA
jgi:hypothetical protein